MREPTHLVLTLDPDTGEKKSTEQWTIAEILTEINRDRSAEWTDYDESDWVEGWLEFVETGGYHSIPELKEGEVDE